MHIPRVQGNGKKPASGEPRSTQDTANKLWRCLRIGEVLAHRPRDDSVAPRGGGPGRTRTTRAGAAWSSSSSCVARRPDRFLAGLQEVLVAFLDALAELV